MQVLYLHLYFPILLLTNYPIPKKVNINIFLHPDHKYDYSIGDIFSDNKEKTYVWLMKQAGENKIEQQQQMVENMGVIFEQRGLRPSHGRVLAYLLLAEPPYKDFYDIQDFLKSSKSTVSTALNFLIDRQLVKYITFNGDRRRYFQVDSDGLMANIKKQIMQVTMLKHIIGGTLEYRSETQHPAFNEELQTLIDFLEQLAENLGVFIEKWETSTS